MLLGYKMKFQWKIKPRWSIALGTGGIMYTRLLTDCSAVLECHLLDGISKQGGLCLDDC